MVPLKTSRPISEPVLKAFSIDPVDRMGTITPHSQLRQLSFGCLLPFSWTSLPQALSEQFADPIYAQALHFAVSPEAPEVCA